MLKYNGTQVDTAILPALADHDTLMAYGIRLYDDATFAPYFSGFGALDTPGFADSESCDNTFISHEDAAIITDINVNDLDWELEWCFNATFRS